jgi:putative CocE/NonD family hydrolase
LGFTAPPQQAQQSDSFVSDPAKPVPFMPRPITDKGWPEWQMYDQRFVDGRPDVLTYQTAALTKDLTITGEPLVHLFAATTGSDADWVVKLIDVYPDSTKPENVGGYEFMLAEEVFRARYRHSFEKPEAVKPGEVTSYVFSLRSRDHTFKAGHRIMVQVQSTWFPLIDRNPQTYVPNIYDAVQADFHPQTHSVYRGGAAASYISLPVNEK